MNCRRQLLRDLIATGACLPGDQGSLTGYVWQMENIVEKQERLHDQLEGEVEALRAEVAQQWAEAARLRAETARQQVVEQELRKYVMALEIVGERDRQAAEDNAAAFEQRLDRMRRVARNQELASQEQLRAHLRVLNELLAHTPRAPIWHTCVICLDDHAEDATVACPSQGDLHYLCQPCFEAHVLTECHDEKQADFEHQGEAVACPAMGCTAVYRLVEVARHADLHVVFRMLDATFRSREKALVGQLEAGFDDRLQLERQRIMGQTAHELAVDTKFHHICNEILTLHCPNPDCRRAFLDFDGCFALVCRFCRFGFCALCLQPCGTDAHSHVARCGRGRLHSNYFGTDQLVSSKKKKKEGERKKEEKEERRRRRRKKEEERRQKKRRRRRRRRGR